MGSRRFIRAFAPATLLWLLSAALSFRLGSAATERGEDHPVGVALSPPSWLPSASFLLGSFRSVVVDALWLRAESADSGWERRHETLSAYRLMVGLDPGNDALRAFLVRRLAIDLPARETDPERRREWIREALALGEESVALLPGSAEVASDLAYAYLIACRGDAVLKVEVPDAARRARRLFERVRAATGEPRPDADFAVEVAAAAEGRDALAAADYAAAASAFAAAGDGSAGFRRLAEACAADDAAAVLSLVKELSSRAGPDDAALLAEIARRFAR